MVARREILNTEQVMSAQAVEVLRKAMKEGSPSRQQAVRLADTCELLRADRDALAEENSELRKLVTEAYPGEHPTNGWRRRAERLNAWPGAVHGSGKELCKCGRPDPRGRGEHARCDTCGGSFVGSGEEPE